MREKNRQETTTVYNFEVMAISLHTPIECLKLTGTYYIDSNIFDFGLLLFIKTAALFERQHPVNCKPSFCVGNFQSKEFVHNCVANQVVFNVQLFHKKRTST